MASCKSTWIKSNHQSGKKRVLLSSEQSNSNLTQVALGFIDKNTKIEKHTHPTMDEFFFFTSGKGIFYINNVQEDIEHKTMFRVPANSTHSIEAISDLEFLYWGISI